MTAREPGGECTDCAEKQKWEALQEKHDCQHRWTGWHPPTGHHQPTDQRPKEELNDGENYSEEYAEDHHANGRSRVHSRYTTPWYEDITSQF